MKTIALLGLMALASFAQADHYDNKEIMSCRVTKMVDYTYFEESLSPNEYPDVDLAVSPKGEYSLDVGGNSAFEKAEGDTVTVNFVKYVGTTVTVTTQHGDVVTLQIEHRSTMARATLRVKETGQKIRTLAYLMCDVGFLP